MNSKQKSQLNSMLSVLGYLEENRAVIAGSKLITDQVAALQAKVGLIRTLTEEQERNEKGRAIGKKRSRDLLIESMTGIGGAMRALAIANDDPELAERVNLKKRDLRNLGPKLTERAAKLHELASESAEELKGLVSEENLAELEERKGIYETLVVSPREAIARRKTLTALLQAEVRGTMTLLRDVLDPALAIYRESNEEFYLGYRNARNIVDAPTRSRATSAAKATPPAPAGETTAGVYEGTAMSLAESGIEAAAAASPSRITEYAHAVSSRLAGTNGNSATPSVPELVN